MSELLWELVGQEVSLWLVSGPTYSGAVLDIGSRWLHLASSSEGALLVPLQSIRLIKVSGGMMQAQCATGELKPALVGRTVLIYSGPESSYKDTGVLEAFDENWLRVRVKNDQNYLGLGGISELRLL